MIAIHAPIGMYRIYLVLVALLNFSTAYTQITSQGRDFWMGFMSNNGNANPQLYLYLSSETDAVCTITIPGLNWSTVRNIRANIADSVRLPSNAVSLTSRQVRNNAVHIVSNSDINCFAMNYVQSTTDGTLVLPTTALGNNYYILTSRNIGSAEFLIVAIQNNTTFTITLPNNATNTVTLNQGQTYLLTDPTNDLTGTRINSQNGENFALFVGNTCEYMPPNTTACDHTYEQQFPINAWGNEYIAVPIWAMNGNNLIRRTSSYKILANTNNTRVLLNNALLTQLNSRQSFTFRNSGAFHLWANQPIQVAQFSEGQSNGDGVLSDPFMIHLSPTFQKRNNVSFVSPGNFPSIFNHFLNIVTTNNCVNNIFFDNSQVTGLTVLNNDSIAVGTLQIGPGSHFLTSNNRRCGFNAYVYGSGRYDSYGYSAGVSLDPLSFDIIGDSNCVGSNVSLFVDFSPFSVTTYDWDFGDGSKSSESRPTHQYKRGGDYIVRLKVTYDNNKTDSVFKNIKIFETTSKILVQTTNNCETTEYNFKDRSSVNQGRIVSWLWDFGDGATSTSQDAKHTYSKKGTYRVVLTATSEYGCTDKDTVEVSNYTKLSCDAGVNKEVCLNESVQLDGTALNGQPEYVYKWEPGQYLSDSSIKNPIARPEKTTVFYLTVTDSIGCSSMDSVKITVKPQPKIANLKDESICAGDSVQIGEEAIDAPGPFTYEWTPSEGLSQNNVAKPLAKPTRTTTYSVNVTSSNGCSAIFQLTVKVKPIPNAEAGTDMTICYGDTVQIGDLASCGVEPFKYEWSPSEGLSDPFSAKTFAFPPVSKTYILKVTDAIGRDAYDTIYINVDPPLFVDAGENVEICMNESTSLSCNVSGGTKPYQYDWTPSTGLNFTNEQVVNASPEKTTTYYLKVKDGFGCQAFDSVTVEVNPNPSIDAGRDTVVCAGTPIMIGNNAINGTPPYSYKWSPADFLSSDSEPNPTATPINTTSYIVTVTDGKGCSTNDTIMIQINPIPTAVAGPDLTICYGDSVQIGGEAFCGLEPYKYEWSPNEDITSINNATPLVYPKETKTYIVKVTDNADRFDYDTLTVFVNPLPRMKGSDDVSICSGSSVIIGSPGISGELPFTYSWQGEGIISDTDSAYVEVNPKTTTLFIQKITDANGCFSLDSILVIVTKPPNVKILGDTITCPGQPVQLNAEVEGGSPDYTYYWLPDDFLSDRNSKSPVVTTLRPVEYKIIVTDANGCKDSAIHKINVTEISSVLRIPEIITTPKTKNLKVPIFLDDEKGLLSCFPDSLYIKMNWDATLYNPTGVNYGSFKKTLNSDCMWEVEIYIPNLGHLVKGQPVVEITGDAMLGRKDTTDLTITDLRWYGVYSDFNYINGRLIIKGICEQGGPRFLDYQDFCGIMTIIPNPAKDDFEVGLQLTSDVYRESLSIVDVMGRHILDMNMINEQYSPDPKDFKVINKKMILDSRNIENGFYNIIYNLDGKTYSQKLIIIK